MFPCSTLSHSHFTFLRGVFYQVREETMSELWVYAASHPSNSSSSSSRRATPVFAAVDGNLELEHEVAQRSTRVVHELSLAGFLRRPGRQ